MKIHIERTNRFYYPDAIVCCEPLRSDADDYYETAPKLLVGRCQQASNGPELRGFHPQPRMASS